MTSTPTFAKPEPSPGRAPCIPTGTIAKPELSLLIPFYNEKENLGENYERIRAVLARIPQSAEVIYVDDGSDDGGEAIIRDIADRDPRVKLISFMKNFGQTAAMEASFRAASGKIYITLDADNQNDPADIPALTGKIREGYGVVSGWRRKRKDPFLMRRLPSRIANWIISRVTGVKLKDYGCTLKAYDSLYLNHVRLYGEMHRFIPAYARYAGARITEMEVSHNPRTKGQSKYGLGRAVKVVLDLITVKFLGNYTTNPIYFFGGMGFSFMTVATAVMTVVAWQKFVRGIFVHANPLFILSVVAFLMSFILILMGVLAEIMTRTYYESQGKKAYLVRDTVGFG